ncbi:hypothetical protein AX17_005206 [Amanita inopinata Kibby_2008]|nr:hypothetical protein AX17_005206 [Amanita inopinata Kibby_2008]
MTLTTAVGYAGQPAPPKELKKFTKKARADIPKLTKDALIQKLSPLYRTDTQNDLNASTGDPRPPEENPPPSQVSRPDHALSFNPKVLATPERLTSQTDLPYNTTSGPNVANGMESGGRPRSLEGLRKERSYSPDENVRNKKRPLPEEVDPSGKRRHLLASVGQDILRSTGGCPADTLFKVPALPARVQSSTPSNLDEVFDQANANGGISEVSEKLARGQRFKPLLTRHSERKTLPTLSTSNVGVSSNVSFTRHETDEHLRYLDFAPLPDAILSPIMLPPSLSKRKQVQNFAIILSGLTQKDLKNCSLVSRAFRFSVYLAAYQRLKRDFPGRRTEATFAKYNINMTNMWPYLVQRQQEVSLWKEIYNKSFLHRAVGNWYVLADRLWSNPDHQNQVTIAYRFILTRFYFLVSVQGATHPDVQRQHVITGCTEVVAGEIWTISVSSLGAQEEYYVLESTCEVIGSRDGAVGSGGNDYKSLPQQPVTPRVDWASYISQHASAALDDNQRVVSLCKRLRWTNHEEYDRGISKHWLMRMRQEGDAGAVKVEIGRRYILACVVANSISGKWMSSTEMEQEFHGLPINTVSKSRIQNRVHLYVPAHHHVESVHLGTRKGQPLHAALAVVQTACREYYILKDNGMQVGCEEEGVSRVWMSILACNGDGTLSNDTLLMAILDDSDNDLTHLWSLIQELSKQLNENRNLSVSLITQTGDVKNQAVHAQTGFVLRRFNTDKSQEEYNAELERMNAAIVAENQGLQHDNKQLSGLIKEYEQTLESIMSTFRNRARDVQESELSLIRDYETKLLGLEDENSSEDLRISTATVESLTRIARLLRQLLRIQGGENVSEMGDGEEEGEEEEEWEPWKSVGQAYADDALEREIELARLEKENEELRRMLGVIPARTSGLNGAHKRMRSPD